MTSEGPQDHSCAAHHDEPDVPDDAPDVPDDAATQLDADEARRDAGDARRDAGAAGAAAPRDAGAAAAGEAPAVEVVPAGGGLRLLAAVVMLPWLLGYGIIGTWTVARGAAAAASGLHSFDAGYTRLVSPAGVILVGALLLAAFAVLLATSMLLLFDTRRGATWAAVAVAAVLLTAGSVWAATSGDLKPGLWVLFFFGLVYAAGVAIVALLRVTRTPGRGRIAQP